MKTYTIQEIIEAIEKQWIENYGKLSYSGEEFMNGHSVRDFVRLALIHAKTDTNEQKN